MLLKWSWPFSRDKSLFAWFATLRPVHAHVNDHIGTVKDAESSSSY